MEYTKRRNLNRGFMKLEVWHRGLDLFDLACRLAANVADFKLKSQFTDAAQSVSANIAEGYGRRTLSDYLCFLYVSKGSLGEAFTRAVGLLRAELITTAEFERFDALHYEVENKLLALIESLETKRVTGQWSDSLPQPETTRTMASTGAGKALVPPHISEPLEEHSRHPGPARAPGTRPVEEQVATTAHHNRVATRHLYSHAGQPPAPPAH